MSVAIRLREFLDQHSVDYETIRHVRDVRARDTAEDTGTPRKDFAKTVFVRVDDEYAMAVLPATHYVSESRLRDSIGAREVRLASETEFAELCPDCDVGAAPPFGNLYGLHVYVSPVLAKDERITFNAGSHEDVIRMSFEDFRRLVAPDLAPMARHEDV